MVEFGVVIPSYGSMTEASAFRSLVQAAEHLGYADAWFADHLVVPGYAVPMLGPDWLEPLACCQLGLGMTDRLRFGTDVLVAPYRNPLLVAKQAASADRLSGGRLTLGLGVGYVRGEFEALSAPDYAARGAVTDEVIDVLHDLWSSPGPHTHHGEHFRYTDVYSGPAPQQTPLPVWVGGNYARAHQRAAARGDGWHPLFPTPEDYAAGRQRILSLRGSGDGFTFSYSCPGTYVVAPGEARPELAEYGDGVPDEFGYAPPFPRTASGRPRFVGTVDELLEDLQTYCEAGVEHFTLRFHTTDPEAGPEQVIEQMERFATQVIPVFRG